jgi:hypothetical protein
MSTLPINGTFTHAIGGDGTITITTPGAVWETVIENGGFFTKDMTSVADVKLSFATQPLQFGDGTFKLGFSASASAESQIQLFFSATDPVVLGYGLQNLLTDTKLLVRAQFTAQADTSATGSFPDGALSATFGIKAGGNVLYERVALFNQTDPAATILTQLLQGIRLPQQIGGPSDIPAAGEVLVNQFGGYLNLSGQLSWGYELKGTRAFQVPSDLQLALNYDLRLLAGLTVGYQLAGDFSIEARKGSNPNFLRLVVRKHRDTQFNLAADFSAQLDLSVTGLQGLTADEFLEKLIGAGSIPVLHVLQQIDNYDSLDKLQAGAGKVAAGLLQDVGQKLGTELSNANFTNFVAGVHSIVDAYNTAGDKLVNLLKDSLTRFPDIGSVVELLDGTATPQDLQTLINRTDLPPAIGTQVLSLISTVWNDKIYSLLTQSAEFSEFKTFISKVKNLVENPNDLKTLVTTVEAFNPFNNIFQTLENVKTPQDLVNLADLKLQGLVEKLLGKAFDDIKQASAVTQAFSDLQSVMNKIDSFKATWFKKIQDNASQSFQASLHAAYSQATDNTELLDVEIDVSQADGVRLAKMAAAGDFGELLNNYRSSLVRINQGVFTHNTTRSTEFKINLLGFGAGLSIDSLTSLIQNTEESIQSQPGGLLHVYTTSTSLQETKQKQQEKIQTNFLLGTVLASFQPEGATQDYVTGTLNSMSVQYTLTETNSKMKTDRLTGYLQLAQFLKLVPSAAAYAAILQQQLGPELDTVSASYTVGYDSATVRAAFIKDAPTLRSLGSQGCRQLIGTYFTGQGESEALLGFAYLSPAVAQAYAQVGNVAAFAAMTIHGLVEPAWYTGDKDVTVDLTGPANMRMIGGLYDIENSYLDRLVQLAAQVNASAVNPGALDAASQDFLSKGSSIDQFQPNGFLCIFDQLARAGADLAKLPVSRTSALTLQITATVDGKSVTVNKILMEPNPDPGVAGAVDVAPLAAP